jgi:2-oxoglutarate dehydrogenase E2 component (dihydrolipoamide succinyltransferase)
LDLETDKVILEVPAIKQGMVKEILFSVGDTVTAGQLLAVIDDSSAAVASIDASADGSIVDKDVVKEVAAMSPSVRKMVAENAVDEAQLVGSGKNGRILKKDVEQYLSDRAQAKADDDSAALAQDTEPKTEVKEVVTGERLERRVPMTRLRARIAERLVQSQSEAAILTTFNEVNMKPVMELRTRYKEAFEKKFGVRLGFMSFFVQASVEALKRFPEINASIDGNDIVYHGYYDIGVAVSGPNGLVVPIVRDADILTIAEIEQSIINYANKAMASSLSLEDITGGTFTISNGGVFGSMLSTPILNPPQSAILGMHNITERAMVVDGEVKVLPMMYLALSYDHRLVDGKSAVQFLVTIKQLLEDPSRLLLGV